MLLQELIPWLAQFQERSGLGAIPCATYGPGALCQLSRRLLVGFIVYFLHFAYWRPSCPISPVCMIWALLIETFFDLGELEKVKSESF